MASWNCDQNDETTRMLIYIQIFKISRKITLVRFKTFVLVLQKVGEHYFCCKIYPALKGWLYTVKRLNNAMLELQCGKSYVGSHITY